MRRPTIWLARLVHNSLFAAPLVLGALSGCAGLDLGSKIQGNKLTDSPPGDGTAASKIANASADKAAYRPVEYANVAKEGPQVVVIPGTVKSTNGTFAHQYQPNSIADWGELELARANFKVLERSNLKAVGREFELAYSMGDQRTAQRILRRGKLKATRWVVGFDILRAEPVADAKTSVDGATAGKIFKSLSGDRRIGEVGDATIGSAQSEDSAGVWLVGMRYRIIDATTTEQVATGYQEQKMEIGSTSSAVLGARKEAKGGTTLDTLVQRLVQVAVSEIDAHYK